MSRVGCAALREHTEPRKSPLSLWTKERETPPFEEEEEEEVVKTSMQRGWAMLPEISVAGCLGSHVGLNVESQRPV